jgi:hypothetical protein
VVILGDGGESGNRNAEVLILVVLEDALALVRSGLASCKVCLKVGSLKSEVIVLPSKLIITSL